MSGTSFRVLLDLTDLHIESFKYVWISISPREIKTISDFKTSILHKINLSTSNIKLFVRDGLLLDDETVYVLREDDTVLVQYEKSFSFENQDNGDTVENKKSSKKRDSRKCDQVEYLNSKKRKRDSDFSATNETVLYLEDTNCEKKKKLKKKHKFHSMTSFDEEINSTVESPKKKTKDKSLKRKHNSSKEIGLSDGSFLQSCNSNFSFETEKCLTEKSKNEITCDADSIIEPFYSAKSKFKDILEKDKTINMKQSEADQFDGDKTDKKAFTECNTGLPNNCPKKKRKRRRKRKIIPEPEFSNNKHIEVPCNTNNVEEFKSFIDTNSEGSKKKHILYDSINPLVELFPEKNPQVETLNTVEDKKNQSVSTDTFIVNDLSPPSYPKVSTPAQSDGCLNPNWRVSLTQNENLNHSYIKTCSLKKVATSKYCKTSDAKVLTHSAEQEKSLPCKVNYEDLPILHSQPQIGAHIAYKILELDANYSPVVSEYRDPILQLNHWEIYYIPCQCRLHDKEGIVSSINPLTEEIEIDLVKHEIKPGKTGKFENLLEDEIPLPEIIKKDVVMWSSLIEPKLMP